MRKEIARILSIFFLIFLFVLSPVSPSKIFQEYLNVNADEDEEEIISEYTEWTSDREVDGYVTINQDATLVIKKGVTVTFKEGSSLIVEGKLFVKGTKIEPVKLRMDGVDEISFDDFETIEYYGYQIRIFGEASFREVDISGGGGLYQQYLKGNNFLNQVYATSSEGAILSENGKLEMNNCYLHDNVGGVHLRGTDGEKVTVNKTIFEDNFSFDVRNDYGEGIYPNFMYNWWRGPDGPEIEDEEYSIYKYISGEINFSNWLTSKSFRKDPVIIIPGILGSEEKDGVWQIDPTFHIYDNLYEELDANGYTPEKDLFVFPYDWRDSNIENASILKTKIREIKQQENWPSVDLIAHSMGGLLAREYIESDYYNNDVDQLITLGTPNNGAPEAYPKWEAGAFTFSPADIYLKHRFSQEAKENGFEDIFHYIQDRIPSIKELLPDYAYLYDVDNDDKLIEYHENDYPINDFLEDLNLEEKKSDMLKVEFDKIVGNVEDAKSTVIGFNVIDADMGEYWENGYPHGFEIPLSDRGMIYGKGDGTVSIKSAKSAEIFADNLIEISFNHLDLPTNAQEDVLEILTGERPSTEIKDSHVKDILLALVFSPVDIQIIDPDGNEIGKDFVENKNVNEIDEAYYSGFNVDNEFLTIPDPKDGEYRIIAMGTGNGSYKIEITGIFEDESTQEAQESTATIEDVAVTGQQKEEIIIIKNGKVTKKASPVVATETETASDDDSDDEDDDSKKDKKKNGTVSVLEEYFGNQSLEAENVFENFNKDDYGAKVFSDSSVNSEGLYERKEENKKFIGVITWAFLVLVISSVAFLVFRRRVDLKS